MVNIEKAVKEIKYFLLDLDGTIYLDNEPIGDMKNTLAVIRKSGRQIIFLTNNSSKSEKSYIEKLQNIGLWEDKDSVYTSGMATAEYLNDKFKGKTVYLLGTEALKKEFRESGVNLIEEGQPDVAVLSYDTELTYKKLCKFTSAIVKGAYYIATHPDVNCPAKDVSVPDVGSFIKLIEKSTGKIPSVITGKPYTLMGDNLKRNFNAAGNRFVMIGDRLNTDIRFGNNNGFYSLLVMSGETTEENMKNYPDIPSFKLNSLNDIVKFLQ